MSVVVNALIPLLLFIGGTVGLLSSYQEQARSNIHAPDFAVVTGHVRSIKSEIQITKSGPRSVQWATVEYGFGGQFYSTKILAPHPLSEGDEITLNINKTNPALLSGGTPEGQRAVMNVVYWCFVGLGGSVFALMVPDLRRRWSMWKKNRGSQ